MCTTLIYEAQKSVFHERMMEPERSRLLAPAPGRPRPVRRLAIAVLGVSTLVACMLGSVGTSLAALPPNCTQAADTVTCKFAYTGSEQTFLVPAGVHSVQVEAVGAPGGNGDPTAPGGSGATASGSVSVTPSATLYLEVGGAGTAGAGGWNGGGSGAPAGAGGGGGASDLRTTSCVSSCPGGVVSLASRLLVAAGGGGGGAGASAPDTSGTGGAGGSVGGDATDFLGGTSTHSGGGGGLAGTLNGGGAGGAGGSSQIDGTPSGVPGQPGMFGQGGTGSGPLDFIGYGGGGGGWYGGGGGGSGPTPDQALIPVMGGGGGGGGSSYAPGGTTGVAAAGTAPSVTITYGLPVASPSTQSLTFDSQPQSTVSASQKVVLTDTGGASLRVSGLTFSGPDAGDFLVSSNDCEGDELDPGVSCEVNVAFAPQAQGPRTAALDIETTDPNSPATVALTGTGGQLPQGPQGVPGQQGQTGPTGPQGPQGPAGKVVCNSTASAELICSLLFQPGTWTTSSTPTVATVAIDRAGHKVAARRVRIRHGRMTVRLGHLLRPGRYQVTITVTRAHHRATLLHETLTISRKR